MRCEVSLPLQVSLLPMRARFFTSHNAVLAPTVIRHPRWPPALILVRPVHISMDRANAIFDQIDADRSGEIDSKEFMMALLGLGQEHETVSDLFRVLDTDGNGSISREEFLAGFDLYQKEEARLAAEARVAKVARLAKEARAREKPLVKTPEQLTAEAELTELRRLTPEQEAAAAKAAQRIGEVAAAAEAAPEEERAPAKWFNGQEA